MPGGASDRSPASTRPRCPQHGLVLRPDGECVVCRREQAPSAVPARPLAAPQPAMGGAARLITGVLALGMLASIGGAVWLFVPKPQTAAEPIAAAAPAPAVRDVRLGAAQGGSAAVSAIAAPVDDAPTAVPAAPNERPAAQPATALEAQAELPAAADPAASAQQAAEEQRSHEEVMAAIAARERARASATASITMYSTSWCGACKKARAHMESHGIAFVDRDVDKDPEAKAQHLLLNPRGSVPTIDVDGEEVLVGFSAESLDAAIARSVARREGS